MRAAGLALVAALTASAFLAGDAIPLPGVGAAAVGIVLGWVVGRGRLPARFLPGTGWQAKTGLLWAIALLGFTTDVRVLAGEGRATIPLAITSIVVALVVAEMVGRRLGVGHGMRSLLGAGTGVCGIAAMAATRDAVDAKDEDVTYAATIVTVLGSIGLLALPAITWMTGLSARDAGAWAGATLHAVPHAIGAGLAAGGPIGAEAAGLVKLTRVAMLGLVVLFLARGHHGARMPREVRYFLAALVLGNVFQFPLEVLAWASQGAAILLVAALVALALQTRLGALRDAGAGPWITAWAAWLAILAAALVVLRLS